MYFSRSRTVQCVLNESNVSDLNSNASDKCSQYDVTTDYEYNGNYNNHSDSEEEYEG